MNARLQYNSFRSRYILVPTKIDNIKTRVNIPLLLAKNVKISK